jgi:CP family cyanate transporter-like MFS transporter
VVLVALNLWPAMLGIGLLLKRIDVDTGLAPSVLGLLITMPVIAFGAASPLAAPLRGGPRADGVAFSAGGR